MRSESLRLGQLVVSMDDTIAVAETAWRLRLRRREFERGEYAVRVVLGVFYKRGVFAGSGVEDELAGITSWTAHAIAAYAHMIDVELEKAMRSRRPRKPKKVWNGNVKRGGSRGFSNRIGDAFEARRG